MDRLEKYIKRDDLVDATHIAVSVNYSRNGSLRGYYIIVKPVTKQDNSIRYILFTEKRRLLFETNRFNTKQFSRAVEMAKDFKDELIAAVVADNKSA
jgi:hypothetical protein